MSKIVGIDPHLPPGSEDISIEDLPVGTNSISFSHARTERGLEHLIDAKENGWTFLLEGKAVRSAKYFVTPGGVISG